MRQSSRQPDLVHDPRSLDPIQHNETLFTEYFELYCHADPRRVVQSESKARSRIRFPTDPALLAAAQQQLGEGRMSVTEPEAKPCLYYFFAR